MPDAVLFDLDGVLADSRVPITSCVNRVLRARGHAERPVPELVGFIGPPLREAFGALGVDDVEACVRDYRELYAEALWDTPTYPGVPEAVRALADDGRRLGIATSKMQRLARDVVEAIGLSAAFTVICGPSPDSNAGKSETVAEALEALGGAAAMVGDRRYDVEAAHAHGLRAVGVTWGFGSREELLTAGADVLVDEPSQLAAALRTP